ncbi:MAG: DUF5668 domain-containing protein [Ignavibacteria bacterium]|nr:DUF5668 domain-containing protein [Ignavibacteria bacterium]
MAEQSPEGNGGKAPVRKESILGGVILIVLGLLFLANNLIPRFDFSDYWPLILVAIGGSLIWKSRQSG